MKRCPCCGYLTIDDSNEIITDICNVCFWQYDEVAQNMPDSIIGANKVSLNTAKKNYKLFGATEERKLVESRKFKMWYYTVSHGQLLLRSVENDKNVDIYFGDLKYLEIPCILDGIKIIPPEKKDVAYLSKKVNLDNLDNLTVTVLLCSDKRYYVVSGIVKVMENNLGMMELPFDTPFN